MNAEVSNGVAFGSGQYAMRCGTASIVKSHCRSSPASTGDSTRSTTVGAKNVNGSAVDLSAVAMCQDFGSSRRTCAGASSFPTTYMYECGPPTSPPVGERKGRQAARGDGDAGKRIR